MLAITFANHKFVAQKSYFRKLSISVQAKSSTATLLCQSVRIVPFEIVECIILLYKNYIKLKF